MVQEFQANRTNAILNSKDLNKTVSLSPNTNVPLKVSEQYMKGIVDDPHARLTDQSSNNFLT